MKNVRIGLETIDRLGFPRERVSLVANRLGAAGGVDRADIEEALETEIAYELPDDPPSRTPSTARRLSSGEPGTSSHGRRRAGPSALRARARTSTRVVACAQVAPARPAMSAPRGNGFRRGDPRSVLAERLQVD